MKCYSSQILLNNDYVGVSPLKASLFNSKNKENLIMDNKHKKDSSNINNNLKSILKLDNVFNELYFLNFNANYFFYKL